MNIDERLEALTQTVEILAGMHRENEKLMTQVLESIARLAHVADIHEERVDDHGERLDNLEGPSRPPKRRQ